MALAISHAEGVDLKTLFTGHGRDGGRIHAAGKEDDGAWV